MNTELLKTSVIDGVRVEIKLDSTKEADKDIVTKFIYELINFNND